ncbi:3-hydroxyacyl-CoA dehydrogenase, partial [Campylobacter jejuni]|nr:3-hydroxyacyl-CoA dehydrogenase [Campylobacter jejuni]EAM0162323.1 3-hydroxyacyl-CoA dehydrogenase [Campylobacter jejuni]
NLKKEIMQILRDNNIVFSRVWMI